MDEEMNPNVVETKEETDRHCPSCGGVMDFDPATGGLFCPYCEYKEEIPDFEEGPTEAEELDFSDVENTANCDWGVEKKTVICKACAAEVIYDALETASVCPFCGSNQVMEAHAENTIAPGGVVPFQISDSDASDLFRKWIKRKFFCPKLAKESAKPKSFKGIYLPYWTFDTNTESRFTAQYGIDRTYRDRNGNTHVKTTWHNTGGVYREFFDDALVFASTKHDAHMLSGIEPFYTKDNKSYKPEYVAGFLSERYSIGIKDAWEVAKGKIKEQIKANISRKVRADHHADRVRAVNISPIFDDITYKYLLLPVWVSNYKYKDKVYQFVVNGQTGKISGKTPISIPRVILVVVLALIAAGIIFYMGS